MRTKMVAKLLTTVFAFFVHCVITKFQKGGVFRNQHYFLLLLFTDSLVSLAYSDILKVQNTTHIYCINDDNDSPLYTLPPLNITPQNSNLLKDVKWNNDDWIVRTSTDIPISAVVDKRWEDFTLVKTNYYYFNLSSSRSVSVLSPAIVEIFARNNDNGIYKLVELNDDGWHHFSVISKSNRVLFYKNDKVVRNETNFGFTHVVFRSRNITYWKVHTYNFRWSNRVTENLPTTVTVPPSNKSYLLLYTSLCKQCSLELIYNNESKIITSKVKQDTEIISWQTSQLKINPKDNSVIVFYRRKNGSTNGHWTLNFGFCDSHSIVSFRTNSSEAVKNLNHNCNTLNHQKQSEEQNKKTTTAFSCITGKFGEECQYSCEKILGNGYKFCQNHYMCDETMCVCAWGTHGMTCQDECKEGTWGLGCKGKCEKNCIWCSKINGTCFATAPMGRKNYVKETTHVSKPMSQKNKNFKIIVLIVSVSITVLLSGVAIVVAIYKWNKILAPCSENATNTNNEAIPLQNITIEWDPTKDINKEDFIYVLSEKLLENSLESEFLNFDKHRTATAWHGERRYNINKNKKLNDQINIPYDYNRVVLKKMESLGSDDYINASYINGDDSSRAYIACPGPKFFTIKDFWRMIWQEEIEFIVMATNFIENRERMCAEYWPQKLNTIYECGDLLIKLIEEKNYEYYDDRTLKVQYYGVVRKIRHLHLKWYYEEPIYPNNIMAIVKQIRYAYQNNSKPILVHSGFGTSRTGILILCDLALQKLKMENTVNLYTLTQNLIKQRFDIVKTPKDYILAHLIVAEVIMEENFPFRTSLIENLEMGILTKQLNYLKALNEYDKIIRSWKPLSELPWQNICSVDGYGQRGKYLVAQQPNEKNTIGQFWAMVVDKSVSHIVFLNERKKNLNLWSHDTTQAFPNVDIEVEYIKSVDKQYCSLTELWLSFYKPEQKEIKTHKVFVYQLRKCKMQARNFANQFISLICDTSGIESNNTPIMVTCNDGINLSGFFVVLSYVIQKYRKEGEIDVYNALRTVRRNGITFVDNTKQLEFIYNCIFQFLETHIVYSSIE